MKVKKSLLAMIFLFITIGVYAQTAEKQEGTASKLGYHAEIPAVNSYTVLKNTTGQQLPDSVLLKINFLRRANENFLWKVNEKIELLILPINVSKEQGK